MAPRRGVPGELTSAILGNSWVGQGPTRRSPAASTQEPPDSQSRPAREPLCRPVIRALPRAAGTLTFKAEAPGTAEECLEDIVGIKICAAERETGKNRKVREVEASEEEPPGTETVPRALPHRTAPSVPSLTDRG